MELESIEEKIARILCEIIDDDAPLYWRRYVGVARCIAANKEMIADLNTLAKQLDNRLG